MTLNKVYYPTFRAKIVYILTVRSTHMMLKRFIKPVNGIKAGYSYCVSRIAGHSILEGMPPGIGIEISGHCNLNCPECSFGSGLISRQKGFMEIGLYEKIIAELKPFLYRVNLYFQGEPMLHPGFFDFLRLSRSIKVTVATNGHFLSEENAKKLALSDLDKIIVSLDGMDSDTYSYYRVGGDFEQVKRGIRNVSDAISHSRSSLRLEIQFLVTRYNEKQIPDAVVFAKVVNAVLRLKSMQIINNDFDRWLPVSEKFRRYRKSNNEYTVKNTTGNHCLRLWLNPVVTWDAKVVPCCFDKNADNIMGDLTESSFRAIWYGEKYKIFRDSLLKDRKSIEICRNCTSGLSGVRY